VAFSDQRLALGCGRLSALLHVGPRHIGQKGERGILLDVGGC